MQKRNLNKLKEISFPLASILVALILGAIIMSAMGYDVGKAYSSLLKGAFGSKNSIAETLIQTTPLIFTALSYAIALRCGLVNLGAEGQLYMGAICGSMVGAHIQGLPPVLHIILVLLCGFIGGADRGRAEDEIRRQRADHHYYAQLYRAGVRQLLRDQSAL